MDCASAHERLSERLDGALEPADGVALDTHLAACPACREAASQLERLDGLCRMALGQPAAGKRVADAVIRDLAPVTVRPTSSQGWTRRWSVVLAASASLAAAVLILLLGSGQPELKIQPGGGPDQTLVAKTPQPPMFQLAYWSGGIEARPAASADWTTADREQPVGAALRTDADGLCEFRCPQGGIVRLDSESEIELTAVDLLTMRRGRLWCQATEGAPLQIVAANPTMMDDFSAQITCSPASEVQTSITPRDSLTVYSAGGAVEVITDGRQLDLVQGQKLQLTQDTQQVYPVIDEVLETSWMLPLLVKRDENSPELDRQINGMLAKIGQTKASYLFRDQLIELGETGAIPLIEFLRSTSGSDDQTVQRINAAEIISQTAPEESIPDLVELLEDQNADVRIAAAKGLERLTGLTQGVQPEDWKTFGPRQREAVKDWRAWLKSTGRVPA